MKTKDGKPVKLPMFVYYVWEEGMSEGLIDKIRVTKVELVPTWSWGEPRLFKEKLHVTGTLENETLPYLKHATHTYPLDKVFANKKNAVKYAHKIQREKGY